MLTLTYDWAIISLKQWIGLNQFTCDVCKQNKVIAERKVLGTPRRVFVWFQFKCYLAMCSHACHLLDRLLICHWTVARLLAIRKHISYTSRVIADFVPNLVTMATEVGRGRIWMASFNSPTQKIPCYTQRFRVYLLQRPSYSRLSQLSLSWQPGSVVVKFDWHHSIAPPQKPLLDAKISDIYLI